MTSLPDEPNRIDAGKATTSPTTPAATRAAKWGRWLARAALTYGLATAAGYVASRLNMPLPWMLGPLFACGAASMFGVRLKLVPHLREAGHVLVALAIGMRFTPHVLLAVVDLLPAMLAATVYTVAITFLGALVFRPLAKVDPTTAFFATAAGGMADMAVVAAERGGDTNVVAIIHALRVTSVVAIVPFVVFAFGEHGTVEPHAVAGRTDLISLIIAYAIAYGGACLLRPTAIPNPWLLGALLPSTVLGATGLFVVSVPGILLIAAQIVLGAWLGCRFRRELLVGLPRVAAAGMVVAMLLVIAAAIGAEFLSMATGLPLTTSFLSLAPAAITEMVLTAKAMNADAELVTAFHIARIAVVASTILLVFKLYRMLLRSHYGPQT